MNEWKPATIEVRGGLKRSEFDETAEGLLEVEADLGDEVRAICRIGHGPRYEEHLALRTRRGTHRVDRAGRTRLGRLRIQAGLAARKALGRPTPTDRSFRRQIEALHAAVVGAAPATAADEGDGRAAVAVVEGCLENLRHEGRWCAVP